jgi:hypothetical protein
MKSGPTTHIFYFLVAILMVFGIVADGHLPIQVAAANIDAITSVTLDGTPSSGTANPTSSSISFSNTTGTGADRLMLVGVSWNCGTTNRTISSATFTPGGGSALNLGLVITRQYTFLWQGGPSTAYRYTAIYSLLNPPSGVTGSINISFSGAVADGIVAGAANFAGVDQTTPLGTPAGATGTSAEDTPNPSVTLTGLAGNELVFDSVFIGTNSTSQTLVASAGQSAAWNVNGYSSTNTSFNTRGAASTRQATGASATMSWTAGGYTSIEDRWAIAAVPIHPVITYSLTASAGTGGTITAPPSSPAIYPAGEVVPITAAPATGYHFVSWTGDIGTVADVLEASTTITMNGDYSITANFAIDTFTLTYSAGAGGTLTGNTSQTVDYGQDGTPVTAVPNTGYHFVDWSDDSTDNPRTDTNITANLSVTANFAINTYTLNYTAGAGGTLTGNTSQTVDYGQDGTAVTAVPNTDYHFVDWSDSSTDNPRTDTNVTAEISVTANFAIDTFTLTYSAGAGGTLTGNTSQTVDYGQDGTPVTAVPNTGYHFVDWSDSSTDNPRTDTNITANLSVTANFVPTMNTLTATSSGHGSVTLNPAGGTYAYGTIVTLTPVPSAGYHFVAWSGADAGDILNTAGVYTIVMDGNKSVTANFAIYSIYIPITLR